MAHRHRTCKNLAATDRHAVDVPYRFGRDRLRHATQPGQNGVRKHRAEDRHGAHLFGDGKRHEHKIAQTTHTADIAASKLIAAPGCYVTTASLALAPLVRAGVVETTGIVVDAASGVSGAGKAPKPNTHFNAVDEDFTAYGLLNHRHTPEIEQAIGAQVIFTPHLVPMNRGILATCYARPTAATSTAALIDLLRDFYRDEPFVVVGDEVPSTKATLSSNTAHITARYDERTGWVIVLSALDNLVKGASGQALQNANIVLGLPETMGLPLVGLYP